jgi:hypothetical protein
MLEEPPRADDHLAAVIAVVHREQRSAAQSALSGG